MSLKKCRLWICFVLMLLLALTSCTDTPDDSPCAHIFGSLIPAQPGSFFAEGTVAHYQCSLCGRFFDMQHTPLASVAAPKRYTDLTLLLNGEPIALELAQRSDQQILWETAPMDLTVGDTLILNDANGGQLDFIGTDPSHIQNGIVQTPGLQAVLTFTATPDALTLSIVSGKYPGMVVKIGDAEYPMTQVSAGIYSFGYAQLAIGDRLSVADNLTGMVYGYDHCSSDSLPETGNYHRGQQGECVLESEGRYRLELLNEKLRITKVYAPRTGENFRITFLDGTQSQEMECLACPEDFAPAAFALEAETKNNKDIAAFVQQEGMQVYSAVVQLAESVQFRIENPDGVVPANRLTTVSHCAVLPDLVNDCISAPEGGSYLICYYPATDSICVTCLSPGSLKAAARSFDLRIAAIPSGVEADYAPQIRELYAAYSTLPASFRWRLKLSPKLNTLYRNLQTAESTAIIYHMATPNGTVYTSKDALFQAFYTDFYYYIVAYHGTEQLNQYGISNVADFVFLAKDFDGRNLPNLYGFGYAAKEYFLIYNPNNILENQIDQGFLGFCYQNGMYADLLPFLQRFFAYWRIDEGYANSTNPGADIFAESWAPTVDIAKFFYYDENTTYVKTDRTLDCFANVACVAYGFDGSDPLPKLQLRGYIFEGWYTDPDFTGEPLTALPEAAQRIHLYAKWSQDKAQQDKDSAALVDVYIYNLTTDRARIKAATVGYVQTMYDALSPEAKALVTQYEILKSFCERYSKN